jgi:hypothetical protein
MGIRRVSVLTAAVVAGVLSIALLLTARSTPAKGAAPAATPAAIAKRLAGHIWAVDEDGTINGALRGKTLELVYLEPGTSDAAAARVRLSRR